MKKLLILAALCAGAVFGLQEISRGHGGTYKGPGDTVPPGAGGGSGGGGPSTPGPSSPGGPGTPGPGTPGPSAPGSPGGGATPGGAVTPGGTVEVGPDLTVWSFWWEFNKDPYLNLKAHIFGGGKQTGADDFFLGDGQQNQVRDSRRPSPGQIRDSVVPALREALERETNNDIVTGCLVALAKIGDKRDEGGSSTMEGIIRPFLADPVQEISETAAVSLGILANDASVETLAGLVDDTSAGRKLVGRSEVNYRTRAFAAYGLGLIGARTADEYTRQRVAEVLLKALRSDNSAARDVRVACLIALGLVPLETMRAPELPGVDDQEAPLAEAWTSREGLIGEVLAYLRDADNQDLVRAHAPVTLARLVQGMPAADFERNKDRICAELLRRIDVNSRDKDNEVLQSCVIALGLLGDNDTDERDVEIREALIARDFPTSDVQIENFSYIALAQASGNMGDGEAPLEESLAGVLKHLRRELAKASSPDERGWVGLSIGVLDRKLTEHNHQDVVNLGQELRAQLHSTKNHHELGALAVAVGLRRDLEAGDILLEKLQIVKDDEARGYICIGLGLMNELKALEPIDKIVRESKYRPELLRPAAIAMGLLGDQDMVDALIGMLEESNNLATQASLSSALGFIGDSRSINPLVAMLRDQTITQTARGFAAAALGIVADKEPLPWNSKIAVDLNYRASTATLNDQAGLGVLNIL